LGSCLTGLFTGIDRFIKFRRCGHATGAAGLFIGMERLKMDLQADVLIHVSDFG